MGDYGTPLARAGGGGVILRSIRDSSLAALFGIAVSYGCFYAFGWPLATEAIAEWIMAETPSSWAVPILELLGAWAKPWAMTGGLAALGFGLWIPALLVRATGDRWWLLLAPLAAWPLGWYASFWIPAIAALTTIVSWPEREESRKSGRREFLTQAVMATGTVAVAAESFFRNEALARRAVAATPLFPFRIPAAAERFGAGLVRKPVTPVGQFYVMSKNTVDPALDPAKWRLEIKVDGRRIHDYSYRDLLSLQREERYQTLRCISNTLKTDLMSTAQWQGIHLRQILERREVPGSAVECAVIGVDGHGCSYPVEYAFDPEFLLALGMNGNTLSRDHGYPVRLLAPRYYGFKNIKWIGEINFVSQPYFGTWPKKGFAKESIIHTMSMIDKMERRSATRLAVGGVSFAGVRGIERVEVRADQGPWQGVECEPRISPYTWTRWQGEVEVARGAQQLEARAMDGRGVWQLATEKPQFPDGVAGPTIRRILI